MTDNLTLREVEKIDYEFLFKLLQDRKPNVSISHKKMSTYSQHIEFIESKPYEKWYIVLLDEKNIGSTYLSKNDEIGISLIEEMQGKGMGKRILELIIEKNPRNRYLANINPNNSRSLRFFEKNGFKLIQHTYELTLN